MTSTFAWLANRSSRVGHGERRLAEGEGFEPPVPLRVQWFSRPPPSTTRPSLPPSQAPNTPLASARQARLRKRTTLHLLRRGRPASNKIAKRGHHATYVEP